MKKVILLFILLLTTTLMIGCDNIYFQNQFEGRYDNDIKISINEHFKTNISNYKIVYKEQTVECLSGDCPQEFDSVVNLTKEENCYFCNSPLITSDKKFLMLRSDKVTSGSMDAFAGCVKKYSGRDIDGLQIISINDYEIKARGILATEFKQNSTICNKDNDPECDDATYGKCSGPNYHARFVNEVEFIIKKE